MSPVYSTDISDDEIERWLYHSGLTAPSVEALRRHFPRWRRYLTERGVTEIPSPLSADPVDTDPSNVLCLLVRQASLVRDPAMEHNLRNLVGVRPYKR
jgi:hypothetical protein